jgi:uncharacterized membrane protein (UPF0127 family)
VSYWRTAAVVLVLLLAGCGQNAGEPDASNTGGGASSPKNVQDDTSKPATSGPCKGVPVERCDTVNSSQTVAIDADDGDVRVRVEVADDMDEMQKGLMGRTALAEDAGMLFVYPEERELSFWMKDTLIPLSIAFMDAEGRIVDIQDMKALDDRPPHYTSAEPARYALEVNEGFFDERGVEVGDGARLPV